MNSTPNPDNGKDAPIVMMWLTKLLRREPSRVRLGISRAVSCLRRVWKRFAIQFKALLLAVSVLGAVWLFDLNAFVAVAVVFLLRLSRRVAADWWAHRAGKPNAEVYGGEVYRRLPRGRYICPCSNLPTGGFGGGNRVCPFCMRSVGISNGRIKTHRLPRVFVGRREPR